MVSKVTFVILALVFVGAMANVAESELAVDVSQDTQVPIGFGGVGKRVVKASVFSDKTGSYGNNLYDGGLYYAELSTNPFAGLKNLDFAALGKLPKYYKLKITYKGKSVIATKGDVGAGGPNYPQIDLHTNLAKALGFPYGLDYVTIEDA